MEPTLQGFLEYHGELLESQYEEYKESLKEKKPQNWKGEDTRKDDIDTITENMGNITIEKEEEIEKICEKIKKVSIVEEKPKKKGRKCGICGDIGHNRRTCPTLISDKPQKTLKKKKSEKPKIVKDELDTEKLRTELYDISKGETKCDMCNNDVTNNMLCSHNDKKYCYSCYKSEILLVHDKNCECIECKTQPLSPTEAKECDDLLTDDQNDYIIYEGVEYSYDESTNIISYDYEQLGIWNKIIEKVDWFNDESENVHLQNIE